MSITVHFEGKDVALPEDVVNAGVDAIRAVLVASGFPSAQVADIRIEGKETGAPSVRMSPSSQGKGRVCSAPAATLPAGLFQCRSCSKIWDGSQTLIDPLFPGVPICGDAFCGGTADEIETGDSNEQ